MYLSFILSCISKHTKLLYDEIDQVDHMIENTDTTFLFDDLEELRIQLAGEYSNYNDIQTQTLTERQSIDPPHQLYLIPIEAPAIGDVVFYTQKKIQNVDGFWYQRIYAFEVNIEQAIIEMKMYTFSPIKTFELSTQDWKNLDFQDVKYLKGCEVYWKKDNNSFVGEMKRDACNMTPNAYEESMYVYEYFSLTDDDLSISEMGYTLDYYFYYGYVESVPFQYQKRRYYSGSAILHSENREDSDMYFQIHSDGDRVTLKNIEGKDLGYSIVLDQSKDYMTNTHVLELKLFDQNENLLTKTQTTPKSSFLNLYMEGIEIQIKEQERKPYFGFYNDEPDLTNILLNHVEGEFYSINETIMTEDLIFSDIHICFVEIEEFDFPVFFVERDIFGDFEVIEKMLFSIEPTDRKNTLQLQTFYLKDDLPNRYYCEDFKKEEGKKFQFEHLIKQPDCEMNLIYNGFYFVGKDSKCINTKNDLGYTTRNFTIYKNMILIDEKNFDSEGNLLWGYDNSLRFIKQWW